MTNTINHPKGLWLLSGTGGNIAGVVQGAAVIDDIPQPGKDGLQILLLGVGQKFCIQTEIGPQ